MIKWDNTNTLCTNRTFTLFEEMQMKSGHWQAVKLPRSLFSWQRVLIWLRYQSTQTKVMWCSLFKKMPLKMEIAPPHELFNTGYNIGRVTGLMGWIPLREGVNWKKNIFFRALPKLPKPPSPPMTPIRATWSSFFGSRNSRFESQFRLYICNLKNS